MRPLLLLVPAACCAAALLGISGCGGSPATRFYTLASLPEGGGSPAIEVAEPRSVLAVGPVDLADYLDRPQIVTRRDETRIALLEFDHWAGSLQSDLARVLVDNLTVQLAPAGYLVVPWEETAKFDGRIHVNITRLEAADRETVMLSSLWTLFGRKKGEILSAGNAVVHEPISGGGTAGIVEAMSRTLAELSRRIADELIARPLWQAKGSSE